MSDQQSPTSLGGVLALLGASILKSHFGRVCIAVLFLTEIYRLGVGSLWQQTVEFRRNIALLKVAEAEADASTQRQTDEARAIGAEAGLRRAEGNAVIAKAKADADAMDAEAITAVATGVASPELEKALADEITAKGMVLVGTATAARDQARATADKTVAQVVETRAKLALVTNTVDAKINALRAEAEIRQQAAVPYLGLPVPDELKFESSK